MKYTEKVKKITIIILKIIFVVIISIVFWLTMGYITFGIAYIVDIAVKAMNSTATEIVAISKTCYLQVLQIATSIASLIL